MAAPVAAVVVVSGAADSGALVEQLLAQLVPAVLLLLAQRVLLAQAAPALLPHWPERLVLVPEHPAQVRPQAWPRAVLVDLAHLVVLVRVQAHRVVEPAVLVQRLLNRQLS